MLIGLRLLDDGRGMDAGLGGKGAVADIGRLAVGRPVEQFIERARDMGQRLQPVFVTPVSNRSAKSGFQQQRGDQGHQIGIAATLADTVQGALDLARAGTHGGQRIGNRLFGVVMGMDAEMIARDMFADFA